MKLKVLIVEDDPLTAHDLQEVLSAHQFETVGLCKSYEDALETYYSAKPEVILADIKLKGNKDGIDLVNEINKPVVVCPVVYLTGNSDAETKSRAFDTNPAVFLTKPFNSETVIASLELAFGRFNKNPSLNVAVETDLFVKKGDQYYKLNTRDILGLQAEGSYSKIFTANGEFIISGNLKYYVHKFDDFFIRIHRSYVVNRHKITSIDANHIYIEDLKLPIGRKYKDGVKKRLLC